MKIINIDLVYYGLIFECFLNLEWKFMFDVDMDFCIDCWDEMIEYVI